MLRKLSVVAAVVLFCTANAANLRGADDKGACRCLLPAFLDLSVGRLPVKRAARCAAATGPATAAQPPPQLSTLTLGRGGLDGWARGGLVAAGRPAG